MSAVQTRDRLYGLLNLLFRGDVALAYAHVPVTLAVLRARGLDGVADELAGIAAHGGVEEARAWWALYGRERKAAYRRPVVGPALRTADKTLSGSSGAASLDAGFDLAIRAKDPSLADALVGAVEVALGEAWSILRLAERLLLTYPSDLDDERRRVRSVLIRVAQAATDGATDADVRREGGALVAAMRRGDAVDGIEKALRRIGEGRMLMQMAGRPAIALAYVAGMYRGDLNASAAYPATRVRVPVTGEVVELLDGATRDAIAALLPEAPRLSAWQKRASWLKPPGPF